MKNLINKSLKIVAIIAMMISVSSANKDEAPVVVFDAGSLKIFPRDYITIHSITISKQNGDCEMKFYPDEPTDWELGWENRLTVRSLDSNFGEKFGYSSSCAFPNRSSDDNKKNEKYIIVLNTNFSNYVYELVYAVYEYIIANELELDTNNKYAVDIIYYDKNHSPELGMLKKVRRYVLPLIDYKK